MYVSLSAATETTNRAAGLSWLDTGWGASTKTATGRVKIAATATATRIQYGPIARTAGASYVQHDEPDGVACGLEAIRGSR